MTYQEKEVPRSSGANAARVRNHNERALLSLMRAHGQMAGAEAAKTLNLSAQTASVILRSLEQANLIVKRERVKGKIGKPQMPYGLNPDGAYAFGFRLGRRSAEFLLMDFAGDVVAKEALTFRYPQPEHIEAFVRDAVPRLIDAAELSHPERVVGLGIAAPFQLWNWLDALGVPKAEADAWRVFDLARRLEAASGLPTYVANDMNMACNAELVFGAGRDLNDFAYFHIGSFVGGGIVLDGLVYHGRNKNAAAFGSIPVRDTTEAQHQLIHAASLYSLENAIAKKRDVQVHLRADSDLFETEPELCTAWINEAAHHLARAITSVAAVLDLQDVVIDGEFPDAFRARLADDIRVELGKIDMQGIHHVNVKTGILGHTSGALGAAYEPLLRAHFLEGSALR